MNREPVHSLDRIAVDLDASQAEIAAGHFMPALEIHAMLQEGIEEIKAKLSAENSPKLERLRR